MKKPKNIPTYYNFPGAPVFRDTTALPFNYGGNLYSSFYNTFENGGNLNSTEENNNLSNDLYTWAGDANSYYRKNLTTGNWEYLNNKTRNKSGKYDFEKVKNKKIVKQLENEAVVNPAATKQLTEWASDPANFSVSPLVADETNVKGKRLSFEERKAKEQELLAKGLPVPMNYNFFNNVENMTSTELENKGRSMAPTAEGTKYLEMAAVQRKNEEINRQNALFKAFNESSKGPMVPGFQDEKLIEYTPAPTIPLPYSGISGGNLISREEQNARDFYNYLRDNKAEAEQILGKKLTEEELFNELGGYNNFAQSDLFQNFGSQDFINKVEEQKYKNFLAENQKAAEAAGPLYNTLDFGRNLVLDFPTTTYNLLQGKMPLYQQARGLRDENPELTQYYQKYTNPDNIFIDALNSTQGMFNPLSNAQDALIQYGKGNYGAAALSGLSAIPLGAIGLKAINTLGTKGAETVLNTASKISTAGKQATKTGSNVLSNVLTDVSKGYQQKKISDFLAKEASLHPNAMMTTSGKTIIKDPLAEFNRQFNKINFSKPLSNYQYKKAINAINPELGHVASLDEIKDVHNQAIEYFKNAPEAEAKDYGLFIRDAFAERLPSASATPNIVEGIPTYSASLHPHTSLHPTAKELFGPKEIYDKVVGEWGYDLGKLTPQEQNLQVAYTKGYDAPLNYFLRFPEKKGITADFYRQKAGIYDQGISRNKFPEATVVRRGIIEDYPVPLLDKEGNVLDVPTKTRETIGKGDIFEDKGFLSTSLDTDLKWGNPLYSELIEIPGGGIQSYGFPNAAAGSSFPHQKELVMRKGLRREVIEEYSPEEAMKLGYRFKTRILNPYLTPLGIGAAAGTTGLAGNNFDQSNYNAYGNMGLTTGGKSNAYGGPLNDRNINGQLLQSTYASPLGNMFREGGPFGENKGTFDYANSIYASQPGNYYGNGGFTVTRSNDRKGKTHKVVRNSDGKTEYYGSEMRNQPKNEKIKAAAEARHSAQGNFKNPFFKAYWDATWKNGGPITKLNPIEEKTFQTFYNTLPDNLQTDDSTYDIRGYWDGLGRPSEFDYNQPKESDGYYHGFSINPNTGEYLKSPAHETFQHAVNEDRKIGYRPIPNVYGRNIATYNPAIIEPTPTTFLTNTAGPINYRTGGQFPRPYSLPEDSFKQGGNNLHNSIYASSNVQYPAIYKLGGNINVVAGGEKHRVYIKESPTGVGEGVKGHVMVNHPTMDKGQWDTIDLTAKSGAKTVAEGIAATKKWHRENPNVYRQGGSVLSMSNTPQLQGEGKDLTYPDNAYIYRAGGDLIKRADGSYSQRGLWDNIRANIGSGKKPTKQMLQQEKKINKNYK